MTEDDFWNTIKIAAKKIGISDSCFRVWKTRGGVPRSRIYDLYMALKGTSDEVSLEFIAAKQSPK